MMRKQRRRDAAVRTTYNEAAAHYEAHESGLLEAESKTERTHKVKQEQIAGAVSRNSAVNAWKHPLTLGPYGVSFSRTGRHALLAGHGGRAAVLDLHANAPKCEVVAGECVRAAVFLHDETMFACAQKKYVYVYDDSGAEIHRMKQHLEPEHLSFLPFHFLLASMGHSGYLKYHDVSTGTLVSEHATRLGSAHSLAQNPQSGVLDVGHGNGVVTLWSPASPQPLARVLAHRGGVAALAHSACGSYLATGGVDGLLKIWDARTFRTLRETRLKGRAPTSLDFSQRGMLAVACANSNGVEVYESATKTKACAPYLSHALAGGVAACAARFRPFEDALLVGHARGVDSILVPGSAEANYDALEGENPFRTKNQRKTAVVRGLLDKLPPETIALAGADFVGQVERDPEAAKKDKRALEDAANAKLEQKIRDKKKTRGRSKLKAKLKKRLKNVISKETNMLRDKVADEAREKKRKRKAGGDAAAAAAGDDAPADTSTALDRLFSRAKKR
jgi:U3 small nucleolar RNA-associated protein 7